MLTVANLALRSKSPKESLVLMYVLIEILEYYLPDLSMVFFHWILVDVGGQKVHAGEPWKLLC